MYKQVEERGRSDEGVSWGLFWSGRQKFMPISEKLSLFLREESRRCEEKEVGKGKARASEG